MNLFDNPESGRHPEATKAVVVITNGNPSDIASMASLKVDGISKNILEVCEARHIIRFVIGVCTASLLLMLTKCYDNGLQKIHFHIVGLPMSHLIKFLLQVYVVLRYLSQNTLRHHLHIAGYL